MEEQTAAPDAILTRLAAALGDRYEIERPLGEGGMAFVYLARDLKHDRQVAIKVLKPELAASLGAERFLREIQLTAKLQHPHILPLYDSGAADALLYYVMPFVVGESLNDYLGREKQLSIAEAVQIAREVAEALGQAHTLGLVHRDIKPDNVMMSGGHAIVADFGIARAVTAAGGEKLTKTGMAVGTPAYMSPEQIGGEDVDGRSDLYSLGCMLYEMLVGQIPFTGPTAMAIMARHTMDQITPPSIMRQSVPPEVEDIVFKAMEKTPADRYRTASEMIEALRSIERGEVSAPRVSVAVRGSRVGMRASQMAGRVTGEEVVPHRRWPLVAAVAGAVAVVGAVATWLVVGGGGPRSAGAGGFNPSRIAVLYFDDLSADGELRYVADGLTEGLIAELGQVQGLDVISQNGVAPFRDGGAPRDSIGRALEAGTLVAGSVESARDGQLRVTTRLIEGETGSDIGRRASFVVARDAVLSAQDSIVRGVALTLREWLGEEVELRARRASTSNATAWTLVQRAEKARKDAAAANADAGVAILLGADSLLAAAEREDPRWLEPVILRGKLMRGLSALESGSAGLARLEAAAAHAQRALEREPTNAAALALRGTIRYEQWSRQSSADPRAWEQLLQDARADLEQAVSADASLAEAQVVLSYLYYDLKDVTAALVAARRGYEADAYLSQADVLLNRLFWTSLDLEQFPPARRWCDEGTRRFSSDPRFIMCRLWLMATPAVEADVPRAWALLAQLDSLPAGAVDSYVRLQAQFVVGGVVGRAGLVDSARAVLLSARAAATSEIDPSQEHLTVEAYMRSLIADRDEAIDLIKQYVAANPGHFEQAVGTSWWWRELRSHPRFSEIIGPSH